MVSAALVGLAIKRGRGLYHAPKQWYRLASTTPKGERIGPDRILPANSLSTTWPDGTVEIRFSDRHPLCQAKPISVWTMLNNTVERCPNNIALAVKRNDKWVTWTYTQYLDEAITVAKAFIKLGLKPHHSVNILGFNAPEWHISAVASVIAGGLTAGIYTTNSIDATRYVAEHSRANIMVVEDEEQNVIQYTGFPRSPEVKSWQTLLEIGRAEDDTELKKRLANQAVNQACTLVYTSGTTGNPKGVMLSQDNLTWTCQRAHEVYDWSYDSEQVVSYLPLSHVAGTFIDFISQCGEEEPCTLRTRWLFRAHF